MWLSARSFNDLREPTQARCVANRHHQPAELPLEAGITERIPLTLAPAETDTRATPEIVWGSCRDMTERILIVDSDDGPHEAVIATILDYLLAREPTRGAPRPCAGSRP